jgi:membrane-bound metal-dependent hydrolase YbcI (DUF457 family)
MLLFGHLGITLGAAMATQGIKQYFDVKSKRRITFSSPSENNDKLAIHRRIFSPVTITETLAKNIDIRFLLIGAILPDIIDKPLGLFHIGSGRSISHTLLFLLSFTIFGLILYFAKKWKRMLVLAGGICAHLMLDSMWLNPHTFFWPFYGGQFSVGNPSDWLSRWGSELTDDPIVLICEVIGFLVIAYFVYFLFKQRKLTIFLKDGYFK